MYMHIFMNINTNISFVLMLIYIFTQVKVQCVFCKDAAICSQERNQYVCVGEMDDPYTPCARLKKKKMFPLDVNVSLL